VRSNLLRAAMVGAWALAMVVFAGCGPGVGGTGTGSAAFDAFHASAASVCEGALAAQLDCTAPPAAMGPVAAGTQPVRFADVAGQVTLELNGNLATLDARCQRLRFSGEFGVDAGGVEGFFGFYDVGGSGMSRLAALSAVPVAGGAAMTVELRDADASVVVKPVLLQRVTSVMPAPIPC
jgi:hypothetical protein